jgi:hypothetical protein
MRTAGAALPVGGKVDVPDLQACEIARGAPERRPPCD